MAAAPAAPMQTRCGLQIWSQLRTMCQWQLSEWAMRSPSLTRTIAAAPMQKGAHPFVFTLVSACWCCDQPDASCWRCRGMISCVEESSWVLSR